MKIDPLASWGQASTQVTHTIKMPRAGFWLPRSARPIARRTSRGATSYLFASLLLLGITLHGGPTVAATLHVEGGQLLGAFGVDVGGTLYDVEFVDGTCTDLFAGCDEAADFTFTTMTDAGLASAALQNQVFLDAAEGAFDTVPELTAGCASNDFLTCRVTTPVARSFDFSGNPRTTVTVVSISNGTSELNDRAPSGHAELVTDGMGDTGGGDFRVYARWSLQRFEACADGLTVADHETGLLWERKTGAVTGRVACSAAPGVCANPHDVNNAYEWSNTGSAADGNAFTVFLASLNAASFAGHTDWRLPSIADLQSIMIGPGVVTVAAPASPPTATSGTNPTNQATTCNAAPCVDPGILAVGGPMASQLYYSETTETDGQFLSFAWIANLLNGGISPNGKMVAWNVRAVRVGSCAVQPPITDGLVAYWSFDEGLGATAGDTAGAIADDGTLLGGPAWTTGIKGGALDFDGVDDRVQASISTDLDVSGGNGVSISAWVNPDQQTGIGWIASTFSGGGYSLRLNAPGVGFEGKGTLSAGASIPNGVWTHISGTYDRSTSVATIYLNGIPVASGQTCFPAGCSVDSPPVDLTIGIHNGLSGAFDGLIDEVYIHDRALTPIELENVSELPDTDGDGAPDATDNCPATLNADQLNTDGDAQGNACDDDDDNDGLLDANEAVEGTLPLVADTDGDGLLDGEEVNGAGTDPLSADTDFDGIPDGADLAPLSGSDCRTRNPNLVLVWGNNAPFGVDHEHSPGLGDRYLMNEGKTLPGLAADNLALPPTLAEDLRSGVQDLFAQARVGLSLPATSNGLNVTNHLAGPPPAIGTPGSPSLLYIVDRSAITDSNFGGLDGLAWTGVNRFSRSCTGGLGSVIIDPGTVPPATDPGYAAALASLVEHVAHEAGHLYGLRHVLRGGLAACSGETHSGDPAVMDYFDDGTNAVLAQCASPGCPVTEPPDCGGNETGDHHNPLYHYLRYVVGDSTADLAGVGITPASWDQESVPVVTWEVQFNFACTLCNLIPLYNVRIMEVLSGGGEVVRQTYDVLTIEELNALTIQLPKSSSLKLDASTTDPATLPPGETPPTNVVLETPLYPPPDREEPVTIVSTLLEVEATSPGVYTTSTLATDSNVAVTPIYEIHPSGTYDVSDPSIPGGTLISTSTYVPPLKVAAAPESVPEPAAGTALLVGIAALLALGRRRREAVKHFT